MPSSFGIPSKLTDLTTHIVVSLPSGANVNSDDALAAYIEKRYGNSNLFGQDKAAILISAKQKGVKLENLKVSPNNARVVEFDLNLESLLKLQKAYLDVQYKVNSDIAVSEKIKHEMALNQFLLGVFEGAKDDISANANAVLHPLETLQGIREAINILSQLSAEDLKAITTELGNRAANATPAEAAHGAGYIVGTAVVELILAKGAGAALSVLSKTKAGAEFLARIGKSAEVLADFAKTGKTKLAEMFSDEAASVAKQKFFNRFKVLSAETHPNSVTNIMLDPEIWASMIQIAGNKIKNGVIKFGEFKELMIKEFGKSIEPHLEKLYREGLVSLDLAEGKQILSSNGKVVVEQIVKEYKEKAIQLAMSGQPQDVKALKVLLHQAGERYGNEFRDEIKKTVEKAVDNVYEGRRNAVINDMLGGHTIYDLFDGKIDTKHVGKTIEQLRDRLKLEPGIEYASSFTNLERANKAQREFIKHYEKEIQEWLQKGAKGTFEETLEIGEDLGMIVGHGKFGAKTGTKVFVVLAKDETEKGFHIVTSFPTL